MSLYANNITIDGVTCAAVLRGGDNGSYTAVFEEADLDAVKGIHWEKPEIVGDCVLPAGYGFTVTDIEYSYAENCYQVHLQVAEQYLGDVTGYQEQLDQAEKAQARLEEELGALSTTQAQQITALQEQMAGLSSQLEGLSTQLTDTQLALCDVYEQVIAASAGETEEV